MEHDAFVPTPASRLLAALRTPSAVSASLPGWQPDADARGELRGRLRLRVGGSTVTYRGHIRLTGRGSTVTVRAEGEEARGTGTVRVSAVVTVKATEVPEPGSTLTWRGQAEATGRLLSHSDAAVAGAVRRLLDRFSAQLAEHAPRAEPGSADPSSAPEAGEEPDVVDDLGEPSPEAEDFDLVEVEVDVPESAAALDDLVPPAEAAHARRTMIGRSAEEVDHAPPRGRYAPVPGPDAGAGMAALRWAAPAAAALVASAVVVGRVLRRRR